ncbi:hypothetical protein ACFQAV_09940 [Companilactobacillus huachuanensis]|uniref:PTS EIIA type-4 domain-containing protein n=1 Tax=Companilactobacillus huachuanensis TaxID=2559914 RepID=A0ABW1RP53_9LACO|nr:hypothetical protein [Companilactobacillus huachuanensis]
MNYIVSSHGEYAIEAIKSCGMITGKIDNFYGYAFDGEKNIQGVEHDYEEIIKNKKLDYKDVTILTDLKSGTPNNAAIMLSAKHSIKDIYTGTSLSDLVFLAMGENIDSVFQSKLDYSGKVVIEESNGNDEEEED